MSENVSLFPTVEPYLNRVEMAKVLGVSLRTLDRFVAEDMPSETWGMRTRVFRASETRAWIEARTPEVSQSCRAACGFVYLIRAGEGPVKIGWVAERESAPQRLAAMQTGNHERLSLLAVFPEAEGLTEWSLHRRFAEHRLRGEWFEPVPEILALAEESSL